MKPSPLPGCWKVKEVFPNGIMKDTSFSSMLAEMYVKGAAENVVIKKSFGGATEMVVVNDYGFHH